MRPEAISEKRPWVSNSIGCHPSQVKSHNEALKELGIRNVHFNEQGQAVAHSRKGRNELLKATDKVDRDGGFGDYTGR